MGKRPKLATRAEQEAYLCAFFEAEDAASLQREVVLNSNMFPQHVVLILADAWSGTPPTLANAPGEVVEYVSNHPDMRKYRTVTQWRRAHRATT